MPFKYWHDPPEGGEPIELLGPHGMRNKEFMEKFPNVKGRAYDSFSKFVGYSSLNQKEILPVTRNVNYKLNPSKHTCSSKCMNAKPFGSACECSCGGKNHGCGGVFRADEIKSSTA